jgi:hypothetical protein
MIFSFVQKKQDKYFIYLLILFAFFFFFTRLEFSQSEDMGIFLSEFALISRHHLPYKDIYEIKDPLFLFTGGLLFKFVGKQSVYLLDALLSISSAILSYKISRKLQLTSISALFASIIFILTINGNYYQTLRTTFFAIVLILFFFYLVLDKKFIIAGITSVLIGGFKMPYLFILPSILPIIINDKKFFLKSISKLFLGFILALLILLITFWHLNILNEYFYMIEDNFYYAKNWLRIANAELIVKPGLQGHIQLMSRYGFNFRLCVIIFFITAIIAFLVNKKKNFYKILFLILIIFLTLTLLSKMVMWPHHLHIAIFFLWPLTLIFFLCSKFFYKKSLFLQILYFTYLFFSLLIICKQSGTVIDFLEEKKLKKFEQNVKFLINPQWYIPPEKIELDKMYDKYKYERTFARLGPNNEAGLAAFLNKNWRLVCPYYAQYGLETEFEGRADQIVNCIIEKPNYVLVDGFATHERGKKFSELKERIFLVLSTSFYCQSYKEDKTSLICIRK